MLSNTAYYWNGMLECEDDCEGDCGKCHEEIAKSFEETMGKNPEITDVFQLGFYVDFKNKCESMTDTQQTQSTAGGFTSPSGDPTGNIRRR